jgi:hypothetical protein
VDARRAPLTYCVTAGVALRIASLSRAVFSTRKGVACDCFSDWWGSN